MTFESCRQLIDTKKKRLSTDEWNIFVVEIQQKIDVFLRNSRITEEQHDVLISALK